MRLSSSLVIKPFILRDGGSKIFKAAYGRPFLYLRLPVKEAFAVEMGGWWVLTHPASHQLMLSGHKLTMAHCFSAKA